MKQAEQSNGERYSRIEHVFRPADDVTAGNESAREVDDVRRLKQQQSACLPGKDQRTLQPQADADQNVADVAEEKEILHAVLPPVQGNPGNEPERPKDL